MRTIISDNGVTRLEVGLLRPEDIERAADMAWQMTRRPPPTYFPGADGPASWLNEATRCVEDPGNVAVGLWLGAAGGEVAGPPYGVVLARPKDNSGNLRLLYAKECDEYHGGSALIDYARSVASSMGTVIMQEVTLLQPI